MGVFYTVTLLPSVPALVVAGYLFSVSPKLPFYANSVASLLALVLLLLFAKTPEGTSWKAVTAT